MTFPISTVNTVPFCGACGWDVNQNVTDQDLCDSCGADLNAFGFAGAVPPVAPVGTPGAADVSFAWTSNAEADSDETSVSVDGALAVWSAFATDTSPTVVAATTGTLVGIRVRSVVNGFAGPYVESSDTTA